MGDINAKGQGILGGYIEKQAVLHADTCYSTKENFALLHSYYSDKLKYVYREPFGYNKCKLAFIHMTALMIRSINGEKKYD
jgi:hypothetical protein